MSQNSLDQIFRSRLAHQETDLSDKVSFEAVMARRSAKPKSGLLKPVLWGIGSLMLVSTAAMYWVNRSSAPATTITGTSGNSTPGAGSTLTGNSNSKGLAPDSRQTHGVSTHTPEKTAAYKEVKNVRNSTNVNLSKSTVSYTSSIYSNTDRASQQPLSSEPVNKSEVSASVDPKPVLIRASNTSSNKSDQVLKLSVKQESLLLGSRFINLDRYFGQQLFDFSLGRANQGQTGMLNIAPQNNYDRNSHNLNFELMLSAGRYQNGLVTFNGGTVTHALHSAGYYQGKVLFNLPSNPNIQLGAGLGFAQNSGSGQLTTQQTSNTMKVDSQVIVIVQPGMPNTYKTVYDTSFVKETKTQQGHISYTQSRINLPLTFNYLLGNGMVSFRVSGTVAPGMLIYQKGILFSEGHTPSETQTSYRASLDARLGFGLLLGLNNHTKFIIEPGIQYFSEKGQAQYGRLLPGVGVGLSFKY